MSLKLFFFQLFGKIKPVEKIEMQRELLYNDYKVFKEVTDSEELPVFLKLEEIVLSDEFKKRKAEIQGLHFKGSKEYDKLKEYEKLKRSKPLKKYFKLKESNDFERYQSLKDSEKLKEYWTLLDYIDKGEYSKEKDRMSRDVFKGSVEEKKLAEYNKLKKMPGIKAYYELHGTRLIQDHTSFYESEKLKKFLDLKNQSEKDQKIKKELNFLKKDPQIKSYLRFEHSKKLKLYHETVDSYYLKRLKELKAEVESEDFSNRVSYLKDRKKFERTPAFKKWRRFKDLSGENDLKFFLKFEKSGLLANYYDVKDSMELKRFLELQEIIFSDAFQRKKEYLEDKNKWEKTEEYQQEQKYEDMKRLPHFINYLKYRDSSAFDFFKKWEIRFEDNFLDEKLDNQKWSAKSLWAENLPGSNFSMPGDLQAYTLGENIKISNKLIIETRKEKKEGLIWKMPAGFVPTIFDYTSGLISTKDSFWQDDGIFEAKIKFNPEKELMSSFLLAGKNGKCRIHLLEMGTKNRLGIYHSDEKRKIKMEGIDISSLKKNKWYIFSLEKSGPLFQWKINDTKVLTIENSTINYSLHINLLSIVVFNLPASKIPARFEVDWVRCYGLKTPFIEKGVPKA